MIRRILIRCLLAGLLPAISQAKGYSSGSHSYSSGGHTSSSSHSFSSSGSRSSSFGGSSTTHSGGGASFHSGAGKSYSAGSSSSSGANHGYSAGKSYSSGASKTYSPGTTGGSPSHTPSYTSRPPSAPSSSGLAFDTAAARAQREAASQRAYESHTQSASPALPPTGTGRIAPTTGVAPVPTSQRPIFTPDQPLYTTRSTRIQSMYAPYYSRPLVVYRDNYNSYFWWWLLDRSLDDRAYWAYHHRYDMDAARYQALVDSDAALAARVRELEAQQVAVNPNYVPAGIDPDLMYTDQYVNRVYENRPTFWGRVFFWLIGIPTALAVAAFAIWLIWVKRWPTTAPA